MILLEQVDITMKDNNMKTDKLVCVLKTQRGKIVSRKVLKKKSEKIVPMHFDGKNINLKVVEYI
jgi:hypothetical protein